MNARKDFNSVIGAVALVVALPVLMVAAIVATIAVLTQQVGII